MEPQKNMTLDEMLAAATLTAEGVLIGNEGAQLLPLFHVQFKDRNPTVMVAPWSNDEEKRAFVGAMRHSMKAFRESVVSYAFMSEAWSATEDPKNPSGLQPRDRETREEVVMITACSADEVRLRMLTISRDDKGVVDKKLVQRISESDLTACGGDLLNLMGD